MKKLKKASIWAIAIATILSIFGVAGSDKIVPAVQVIVDAVEDTLSEDVETEVEISK